MSEEIKTDEGVPAEDESKVQVDRAELERLQTADKSLAELDKYAKEAGTGGVHEYVGILEEKYYEKEDEKPPPVKPVETPPIQQDAVGMDEETKKQIEQANRNAAAAFVASQRTAFEIGQNVLPEDQRSPFSTDELQKMIYGEEKDLVVKTSRKFGGNMFAAANYIATIDKGTDEARKQGAAAEVAKASAAASTALPTGGKPAEQTTLTPAEKVQALHDKAADEIYPDDPAYEIPITK